MDLKFIVRIEWREVNKTKNANSFVKFVFT